MEHYTKYTESELMECVVTLNCAKKRQEAPPTSSRDKKYMTTTNKYAGKELYKVATIPSVDL